MEQGLINLFGLAGTSWDITFSGKLRFTLAEQKLLTQQQFVSPFQPFWLMTRLGLVSLCGSNKPETPVYTE